MERVARLVALFAFGIGLLAGCAKDTVSAPSKGSQPSVASDTASQASPGTEPSSGGSATGSGTLPPSGMEPSPGSKAPTSSEGEVQLRLHLKEGDSHTFDVFQEAQGGGLEAKMAIAVEMKVLAAQGDTAKVQLRVANARLIEGNENAQRGIKPMLDRIKGQSVEVEVDSRGRVKDQRALPPGSIFGDMLQGGLFKFTLPEKPVAVGSTWSQSTNVSGLPGATRPVEYAFKVTGIQRVGGRTVVTVESNASHTFSTGPEGQRPTQARISMKVHGTMKIDAGTGLVESVTSNTETSMTLAEQTEVIRMFVRVTRK